MKDSYGREIEYMRISITDRCNLRCRYCMPEGIRLCPMEDIMTYEEIRLVCREAVKLGISKFKITGGEPLVRRGCEELIRQIKEIPGTEQVTMTTNGVLLGDMLPKLREAGLDAVNISLDTLRPQRFREITGFDCLGKVLGSVETALDSGLKVKINAVLQEGVNEEEWRELLLLARDRRLDVRFIEMMPIGGGRQRTAVSNDQLLDRIRQAFPGAEPDESSHGNGPAVYYRIPGFSGSVGFISAIHGVFCGSCNRIRMTSTGEIKPCLCYQERVSVKEAARAGDGEEVGRLLEEAVWRKPRMHCFNSGEPVSEQKAMAEIGG